jgi:hypothetical protein
MASDDQHTDARHRRLLRARHKRLGSRAEQRHELTASHSITWSARVSSTGGTSRLMLWWLLGTAPARQSRKFGTVKGNCGR